MSYFEDWGVASQSNPILNALEWGREDPASCYGGILTSNEQQSAFFRHSRAYKMEFLPKDTEESLSFPAGKCQSIVCVILHFRKNDGERPKKDAIVQK